MTTELTCVGDFAWDLLIRTDSRLERGGDTFGDVLLQPGGSAANVAVWARRCGVESHFVGKVGTDRLGQLAHENLADEGVHDHMVGTDSHLTGSVGVFVDHTGERSMVSGHGADHYLLPAELPHDLLATTPHLHLTAWSFFIDPPRSAARRAAAIAKDNGARLSFDPSSFQLIGDMGVDQFLEVTTDLGVDVLLPNREEGSVLTGETDPEAITQRLSDLYEGADVVLKLDADGALLHIAGQTHHVASTTSNLVDATGAGDAFAGAYLACVVSGIDEAPAARFACQVAAWVIGHLGARPITDRALEGLLASSPMRP